MVVRWIKWLFLCILATLHYHLFILISIDKYSITYPMAIFLFIIFILFVAIFYCLDIWLIRHNNANLTKYFLRVVGLRIIATILFFILALVGNQDTFYAIFPDIYVVDKTVEPFTKAYVEFIQTSPIAYDEYKQYRVVVGATIFLIVEFWLMLGGIGMLGGFFSDSEIDETSEK